MIAGTTWEGGIRHDHSTVEHARAHYQALRRSGVPCSLYLEGECIAAANGASDVTAERREAIEADQ